MTEICICGEKIENVEQTFFFFFGSFIKVVKDGIVWLLTDWILRSFLGFVSTRLRLTCLDQGYSYEKFSGCSAARTQVLQDRSHTLKHEATQDAVLVTERARKSLSARFQVGPY